MRKIKFIKIRYENKMRKFVEGGLYAREPKHTCMRTTTIKLNILNESIVHKTTAHAVHLF